MYIFYDVCMWAFSDSGWGTIEVYHTDLSLGMYRSDCIWMVPGTVDPLED